MDKTKNERTLAEGFATYISNLAVSNLFSRTFAEIASISVDEEEGLVASFPDTLGEFSDKTVKEMWETSYSGFIQALRQIQAEAWAEGYQAGQDDASRQSMIETNLREAHTNPYEGERKNDDH